MKKILFSMLIIFLVVSCFGKDEKNEGVKKQESKIVLNNTGATNTGVLKSNTGSLNSSTGFVNKERKEKVIIKSGLEKELEEFNIIYQKTLSSTLEGNQISIGLAKNIKEKWDDIVSKYRGYKVKGFEKTVDLDNKLITVGINLLNVSDFVSSGKMESANEELQKVGVIIGKIREENGIKSISDDMLTINNKLDEIILTPDNKDIKKFDELRLLIEKLTEYNKGNKEYKSALSNFEKEIINITQLSGEEYKTRLIGLKATLTKIKLMYFGK